VDQGDEDFLFSVYASTREDELALTDWDDKQKEAFARMQFNAQHRYYTDHYAEASFQVILVDGQPAGRLYVARWPEEIRIVDIALLPKYRNAGIGTLLLESLLAEGAAERKRITIHVERFNPAMNLYRRLGFTPVADVGVYVLMTREPGQVKTAS
jgi:ribosomal protein S18 acetylase RimI-like enzyme